MSYYEEPLTMRGDIPFRTSNTSVSPFAALRLRRLLTWPAASVLVFGWLTLGFLEGTDYWVYRAGLVGMEASVVLFAWLYLECRRSNVSYSRLLGRSPNKPRDWLPVLLFVPLILQSAGTDWIGEWARYYFTEWFGDNPLTDFFYADSQRPHMTWPQQLLVRTLTNCILAPFLEEFLFRGVMLHRLAYKWGLGRALLLSSFINSILHRDFLGSFLFCLLMAVLYVRSSSLWIPITIHGLYNTFAIVIQIWPQQWDELVCLAVGLATTAFILWKYWPAQESWLPYFQSSSCTGRALEMGSGS